MFRNTCVNSFRRYRAYLLCAWKGVVVCSLIYGAGCRSLRPDDDLEPNDDFATSTAMTPGEPVTARANEGNPDVFSIEAAQGQTIIFRLESLGLEDCAAFTVTGPGEKILYQDSAEGHPVGLQ